MRWSNAEDGEQVLKWPHLARRWGSAYSDRTLEKCQEYSALHKSTKGPHCSVSEVVHTFKYFEYSALHLSPVCVRLFSALRLPGQPRPSHTSLPQIIYYGQSFILYDKTEPSQPYQSKPEQGQPSPSSQPHQSCHRPRGCYTSGCYTF